MTATRSTASTRRRLLRSPLLWVGAVVVVLVVVGVALLARAYLRSDAGQAFLLRFPGESALPAGTPGGFPWWVQWQHSLNFVFILLIIRSGWLMRTQARPEAYWTRTDNGRLRTRNPPKKISLYLWFHLSMDVLWLVNGAVFIVLLFVTGQWARVVPTRWDTIPNAWSAALQYASFDWPVDDPWVNYNALQLVTYFAVIFIAAPLAAITGVRMSPVWRAEWRISRIYPVTLARRVHFPVMLFFSAFIVVHLALVLSTGVLRNLDVMYAATGKGSESWWGLIVFLAVMVVAGAGWVLARPLFLQPVASLTGRVSSR